MWARITPAYAGKSWENVIYWDTDRDHPRTCGEKTILFQVVDVLLGITSAYAGKSIFLVSPKAFR